MTELEKAKETIKWLDLFEIMLNKANETAINQQSLYTNLKSQISKYKEIVTKINSL